MNNYDAVAQKVQDYLGKLGSKAQGRVFSQYGGEAEYLIVDSQGNPGHVSSIFEKLHDHDHFRPKYDIDPDGNDILSGFEIMKDGSPRGSYVSEAGISLIEANPYQNHRIHDFYNGTCEMLSDLLHAASQADMRLLSYGILPNTLPSRESWYPKARPLALRDIKKSQRKTYVIPDKVNGRVDAAFQELFRQGVDVVTMCASYQSHYSCLSWDEALKWLKIGNRFAPILNAMCANSSIYGGQKGVVADARQLLWHGVHTEQVGMLPEEFDTLDDLVGFLLDRQVIVVPDPEGRGFVEKYMKLGEMPVEDVNDGVIDLLWGTLWYIIRISQYFTVEFRGMAPQLPGPDHDPFSGIMQQTMLTSSICKNADELLDFSDFYGYDLEAACELYWEAMLSGRHILQRQDILPLYQHLCQVIRRTYPDLGGYMQYGMLSGSCQWTRTVPATIKGFQETGGNMKTFIDMISLKS